MPPPLPAELMNEIFRCVELEQADLLNCCLLSRRQLPSAQRWLYHAIRVELSASKVVDSDGAEQEDWQYTPSTWQLFRSLSNNEDLQRVVRSIAFAIDGEGTSLQGIRALPNHAISNFISLAPSVHRLLFMIEDYNWTDKALSQLVKSRSATIRGLYMEVLSPKGMRLASEMKGLRQLACGKESEASDFDECTIPTNLEGFRIETVDELQIGPFLQLSANTLGYLYVPFNAFLDLDFTQLPKLKRLEVALEHFEAEVDTTDLAVWSTFSRSTVTTLVFDGSPLDRTLNGQLFGSEPLFLRKAPPSLRRIEFLETVSLDQVRGLLNYGGLQELALPEYLLDDLTATAVQAMCSRAGTEFIRRTET